MSRYRLAHAGDRIPMPERGPDIFFPQGAEGAIVDASLPYYARLITDGDLVAVPDTTVPPNPDPVVAVGDVLSTLRDGRSLRITLADLVAFIGGQPGGPTLALSTLVFKAGVSSGALLATISMPAGWQAVAETTFGGRIAVSGANLVAASDIPASTEVTGSIRLKATSPDQTTSLTKTFAVAFEAVGTTPIPVPTRPIGVATGLLHGMPLAIAA